MGKNHLPDECAYWLTEGEQCGRSPITGDYFEVSDVKGERLVTSNCERHDRAAARAEALARGIVRRDRRPALQAVSA